MTKATLTATACATLMWAGMAQATPTPQQACDAARINAWRTYSSCIEAVIAKDAKGTIADQYPQFAKVAAFAKCRHAYFKKWTSFQANALLAGSTCIGARFTDNGEMVADNFTGLQWEKKTTTNFVEYPVPTANSSPDQIIAGPDGNLWFLEEYGHKIGRVTTSGVFTEFPIPTGNDPSYGITAGPDGNVWFTEYFAHQIGRVTTDGVFTEYPIPTAFCYPFGVTAGPDGNLWFTEQNANKIGKVTPGGSFTEYTIPTASSAPDRITAGPDGNLWFSETHARKIGKVTTAGIFTEYPMPTADGIPFGITAGLDGNLWFTEQSANAAKIGKVTTGGVFTEYIIPTTNGGSYGEGLTTGPDGNLWVAENDSNGSEIVKVTTAGNFTHYRTPTARSYPTDITAGPDGNLWFTENNANKIGKLLPGIPPSIHDCPGNLYSWSAGGTAADGEVFQTFLVGLNAPECFAGQCDWRLPTLTELHTIVLDFACTGRGEGPNCRCPVSPCIDPILGTTFKSDFWSSTSSIHMPDAAWIVGFTDGNEGALTKTVESCVRATRGGL